MPSDSPIPGSYLMYGQPDTLLGRSLEVEVPGMMNVQISLRVMQPAALVGVAPGDDPHWEISGDPGHRKNEVLELTAAIREGRGGAPLVAVRKLAFYARGTGRRCDFVP